MDWFPRLACRGTRDNRTDTLLIVFFYLIAGRRRLKEADIVKHSSLKCVCCAKWAVLTSQATVAKICIRDYTQIIAVEHNVGLLRTACAWACCIQKQNRIFGDDVHKY